MQSTIETSTFGELILIRQAQAYNSKNSSGLSGLTTTILDQNPIGGNDSLTCMMEHIVKHVEEQDIWLQARNHSA